MYKIVIQVTFNSLLPIYLRFTVVSPVLSSTEFVTHLLPFTLNLFKRFLQYLQQIIIIYGGIRKTLRVGTKLINNKMIKSKITIIAMLLVAISISFSACKKDTEDFIDCFAEGALVHINHTVDTQNSKTIHFEVTYSGDHNLDNSIKWDFGDGTVETLNGATAQHTYSATGTFHAKAEITVRNGDAWCGHDLTETVDVN